MFILFADILVDNVCFSIKASFIDCLFLLFCHTSPLISTIEATYLKSLTHNLLSVY